MTASCRCLAFAVTSLVLYGSAECRAEWGRYRAVTSYSFPTTPVYTPGVAVQSYRPMFVAPAAVPAVASSPLAVAPPIIYSPQTAHYAPAPVTSYYAPAPVATYYAPAPIAAAPVATYYAPAAVQPMVVARPIFRRAPAVYSFTPSRAAVAPAVFVP